MLEKADLTYRQAEKAVEQVNAGVFTMSAFVDALSLNEEATSRVEILQVSTATTDQPGTTKAETTELQPLDVWDLKQHGKWEFWGDYYGWKRHDIRFADHAQAVLNAPWAVAQSPVVDFLFQKSLLLR